ncbi:MAG: sigma-70 family RNA polymerase sigma factor [Myxococcota bacterium]
MPPSAPTRPWGTVAPSPTALDDAQLCQLSARGDQDAFAELCRRHAGALVGMARSMGLSDADASDVAQEALCHVLEKRHLLATVTRLRGWLYRVALNLARTRARTEQRRSRLLTDRAHDVPVPQEAEAQGPSPDELARFRAAESQLSPRQRDVVTLRCAGLSFAEVARALGTTENACKVHFHNAVKRLKEAVEKNT